MLASIFFSSRRSPRARRLPAAARTHALALAAMVRPRRVRAARLLRLREIGEDDGVREAHRICGLHLRVRLDVRGDGERDVGSRKVGEQAVVPVGRAEVAVARPLGRPRGRASSS